jgi:hypothetical protein
MMSKRLQVILEDDELAEIQRAARRSHMTSSEWVRQALRKARRAEPGSDLKKKLESLQRAGQQNFPTGDIDQMLAEIEKGRLGEVLP